MAPGCAVKNAGRKWKRDRPKSIPFLASTSSISGGSIDLGPFACGSCEVRGTEVVGAGSKMGKAKVGGLAGRSGRRALLRRVRCVISVLRRAAESERDDEADEAAGAE